MSFGDPLKKRIYRVSQSRVGEAGDSLTIFEQKIDRFRDRGGESLYTLFSFLYISRSV